MAEKNNLKEMVNEATIQGTLLNNTVAIRTDKNNRRYLSGELEVMTENDCTVPVSIFTYELKTNGEKNPMFERLSAYVDYPSARTVGVQKAPKIVISKARIENNNFYSERDNRVVNTWRVNGSFVRTVASDAAPINQFQIQGIVGSIKEVVDREGETTGDYDIKLLNVGFGGRVNEITLRIDDKKAADYINANYEVGNLVTLYGEIFYEQKERVVQEDTGFGEPIKTTYTNTTRLLRVTAGKEAKDGEEAGYKLKDLQTVISQQNNNITERYNARAQVTASASKTSGADLLF